MGPQCSVATPVRGVQRALRTLSSARPASSSLEGDEYASRDLGEMERAARIAGPPGRFPGDLPAESLDLPAESLDLPAEYPGPPGRFTLGLPANSLGPCAPLASDRALQSLRRRIRPRLASADEGHLQVRPRVLTDRGPGGPARPGRCHLATLSLRPDRRVSEMRGRLPMRPCGRCVLTSIVVVDKQPASNSS